LKALKANFITIIIYPGPFYLVFFFV